MKHIKSSVELQPGVHLVTFRRASGAPLGLNEDVKLEDLVAEAKDKGIRTRNHYFWCALVTLVLDQFPEDKIRKLNKHALADRIECALKKSVSARIHRRDISIIKLAATPRHCKKQLGSIGRPEDGGPTPFYGTETKYFQPPKFISESDFNKFDRYELIIEKGAPIREIEAQLREFLKKLPRGKRKDRTADLENVRRDLILLRARDRFGDNDGAKVKAEALLRSVYMHDAPEWPLSKKAVANSLRRLNGIINAAKVEVGTDLLGRPPRKKRVPFS